jgi:hypothetical protein
VLPAWVNKIRTDRTPTALRKRFKGRLKDLLPASHHVYDYFSASFDGSPAKELVKQRSRVAIAEMIKRYGTENVAFMHLPQKDEINGPGRLGLEARQAIEQAGGRLFDGFRLCGMTPADYYVLDGHPNRQGYGKIARCVSPVIQTVASAPR